MKKTVIMGSMIFTLIAGSAFAMDCGSGHGSMHGGRTGDGQMGEATVRGSVNHSSMDHDSMNSGSMDHSSAGGQNMQTDHDRMTQNGTADQNVVTGEDQHQ